MICKYNENLVITEYSFMIFCFIKAKACGEDEDICNIIGNDFNEGHISDITENQKLY